MRARLTTIGLISPLLMFAFPVLAYERPQAQSLNGDWDFVAVEPMIDIVADRVSRPDFPQLSPTWDEVIDPQALPPWKADWQPVTVPRAWEHYAGTGYNGAGWYARYVDIPPEWCGDGRRLWLEFDAVATAAGVWVENEFIGAHVGDYSRWRVELTDVVQKQLAAPRASAPDPGLLTGSADVSSAIDSNGGRDARPTNSEAAASLPPDGAAEGAASGTNNGTASDSAVINPYTLLIAVYVDELPGHITQGFLNMIAPHHGGIWQDVRMYATGPVSIRPDGVNIVASPESRAIKVELDIDGFWHSEFPIPDVTVYSSADDSNAYIVYDSVADDSLVFEYNPELMRLTLEAQLDPAGIEHWSPDSPRRYFAYVELNEPARLGAKRLADQVTQTFAFRDVAIEGSRLLLNGEPLYIRSALNWGYYPGAISPDPGPDIIREEFAYIKSLGFNAETVCLVNMPDYFYDIADEMGMLIWQEYPTWHNDFSAAHLPTLEREFDAFMRRDRNHPSIIMRSLSVEAGVEDQEVMRRLYWDAKNLTFGPVQDNNSWFSHSNPDTTDWYGEDYYLNCNQWAKHMLKTLPARLDEYPGKPYVIGETMCFNCWPDIDGLSRLLTAVDDPALAGASPCLFGSSEYFRAQGIEPEPEMARQFGGPSPYPYWYPICFDRCAEIEWDLAERYNNELAEGEDIIFDYLMPQSLKYAEASRRFQMQLMHADPRYRGYTINVVRDIPQLRGGLIDDLGRHRCDPADWEWHGDGTSSPVLVEDVQSKTVGQAAGLPFEEIAGGPPAPREAEDDWREQTAPLLVWDDAWGIAPDRSTPVYLIDEGYSDLRELFADWPDVIVISAKSVGQLYALIDGNPRPVIVTSVLTYDMVEYMSLGGVVVLLSSKWPGALGSHHHYFWRDSFFAPPVGPFDRDDVDKLVQLHPFDLTFDKAEVIPVDDLGITAQVDPLIRLYDTHDLSTVITYDALFATRVGQGMLVASSLDHGTTAGQWVLGELTSWAEDWYTVGVGAELVSALEDTVDSQSDAEGGRQAPPLHAFPVASIPVDDLRQLATARANRIIPLDEGWRFILDQSQEGERLAYYSPTTVFEYTDEIRCGKSWESQGFNYDGMAWYRRWIDIPEDWFPGRIKLVAEGVDDAYTVWVNGEAVATHGSFTDHEQTVWLKQTVTDITDYVIAGEENFIVLEVMDIVGQGGVYKPLYLAAE